MLTINLLPPQQRLAEEEKESTRKIVFSFIILFFILAASWIMLFSVNQIIKQGADLQKTEIESYDRYFAQENNKKIEQDVENINKALSRISTIEKNKTVWSDTLIELSKIAPRDIRFSNIKLDKQEKTITILGLAKTREEFLQFQNDIEKSEYFEKVVSPASNIISPENINFQIEATLTAKALQNQ